MEDQLQDPPLPTMLDTATKDSRLSTILISKRVLEHFPRCLPSENQQMFPDPLGCSKVATWYGVTNGQLSRCC